MITTGAEAVVAEIHTGTITNADVPSVHTTMTDLNLWEQDSQHLAQNRAGTSPDLMTDATTAETAETIKETVETTVGNRTTTVTGKESGADQT